jgi:hypothetical protein
VTLRRQVRSLPRGEGDGRSESKYARA